MKTNNKGKMVTCLALVATTWFVGAPAVSAATYTFRQGVDGYTGASSTYTEYQPAEAQSYNYGSKPSLLVYTPNGEDPPRKTGFMLFDLTSVDDPLAVNSATLSIAVAGDPIRTPGYSLTYNVYSILRPGLNFGNSNGVSQNGALSFNAASFDSISPIGWGLDNTGTYGPVAGQDYGTTSIGSFTLTNANINESFLSFNLDNATVASWINNPATNYGFVIVADAGGDQAIIYTGNEGGAIYRPQLTIDAQAIPEPGSLTLLGLGAVAILIRKRMQARKKSAV